MGRAEPLSPDQVRYVERSVRAFGQALARGERPAAERYLEQTSNTALKRALLDALLHAEWDFQRQHGATPAVDPYLTRYAGQSEWVAEAYQHWSQPPSAKPSTTPSAAATLSLPPHRPPLAGVAPAVSAAPAPSVATASTAATCHYLRHNVPVGPFTWDQLMKLARAGDLRPRDQVHLGNGDWQEAGQINGLFASRAENKGKELHPGEVIAPDYMLLELIGRGGMGDVYKVFRISLKPEYALKIIRQDRFRNLSPEMKQDQLERFQKEMQTTARLKHDFIVAIHDTGDHFGLPFYTMDFVETSLAHKLRQGPLDPRQAAEAMAKTARGVHHANGEGIIHRDIKPHNILLDRDKPLLADLGLAAALEVLQGRGDGEIAGTAAYMAPEQARGGVCDARTDVYGLGATLYHLVTGRPPHQASNRAQILEQVIGADALPPRQLNPAVDRNLDAVIRKCLEKNPERRYATAGLLADDLERFLKGYPVHAKIPSLLERVQKWGRREPIKAVLAGGIVGLLGVLVGLLGVLYLVQAIGNARLRTALVETSEARATAEANEAEAKTQKAAAEAERDRAASEREKASALANILGMRVFHKMKQEEDPARAIENLRKQIALEERQLKAAAGDDAALQGVKLDLADNYRATANLLMQNFPKQGLAEAIDLLGKCVVLQEDLGKALPILKVELGLNYLELAGYYGMDSQLPKELETDRKALHILQDVRKQGFKDQTIQAAIGEANLMLGFDYVKLGQKKIALGHQKEAVRIFDTLAAAAGPGTISGHAYQRQLGRAYQQLGTNLDVESPAEAIAVLKKAEKIFADKSQYRRNLAEVKLSLGQTQVKNNEAAEALVALESAGQLTEQLLKETPLARAQAESLTLLMANILAARGTAYEKKGDAAAAEDHHKRSLDVCKKVGVDALIVNGCLNLSKFYANQRRYTEAIATLDTALPLQEKLVDKTPADYTRRQMAGHLLYEKAVYLRQLNRWNDAYDCCLLAKTQETEALRLTRGSPSYGQNLYATYQLMFELLNGQNRGDEATKVRFERDRLWWGMALELAKTYQGEDRDAKLPELLAFFEHALNPQRRLLDAERLRTEPAFEALRARPEFARLLQ